MNKILILFLILLVPLEFHAQDTDWFQKGLASASTKEQIACFTKCIELGTDLSGAYFSRACARWRLGDAPGAIADYTQCIRIDSTDAGAYYNRAMVKKAVSAGDPGVLEDLERAFELVPSNGGFINMLNDFYLKTGNYRKAIGFYQKVLTVYPGNGDIYENLGYCFLAVGDYPAAMDNFGKANSFGTEVAAAHLGLALAYYYTNDAVNARNHLDRARSLNPLLMKGAAGFEKMKKEGYWYTAKDNEVLRMMVAEWK